MPFTMRRASESLLAHTLVPAGRRRWRRGRLLVLAYHDVPDPQPFAVQLDHLLRHYTPVDLPTVVAAQYGTGALPAGAALITFDDGHPSVLDAALPALRHRGIPAVLFVVTGLIESEQPHWWTEVEERSMAGARARGFEAAGRSLVSALKKEDDIVRLQAIDDLRQGTPDVSIRTRQLTTSDLKRLERDGIAIGSHSVTHPCLDRCSDENIVREVVNSFRQLTDMLGHEPLVFAYPNGNHDERVVTAVRAAGYRMAFRFDHRIARLPAPDPMLVSRVRVNADDSLDRFALAASGVHSAIHRLSGRR